MIPLTRPAEWMSFEQRPDASLMIKIDVYPGDTKDSTYGVLTLTNSELQGGSCYIESGFTSDKAIGNVCSMKLAFTVIDLEQGKIEWFRIGQLCTVSLCYALYDFPSSRSEWIDRGSFYVTDISKDENLVSIVAYDWIDVHGGEFVNPSGDVSVRGASGDSIYSLMPEILSASPWYSDARVREMTMTIRKSVFEGDSPPCKRDLLQYTAIFAASNIALNYKGKAYFVEAGNSLSITDEPMGLVTPYSSLSIPDESIPISGINLKVGEEQYRVVLGFVLDVEIPDGIFTGLSRRFHGVITSRNLNRFESAKSGKVEADALFCSPRIELGDKVSYLTPDGYVNVRLQNFHLSLVGDCSGRQVAGIEPDSLVFNSNVDIGEYWVHTYIVRSSIYTDWAKINDHMVMIGRIDVDNSEYNPGNSNYKVVGFYQSHEATTIRGSLQLRDSSGNITSREAKLLIPVRGPDKIYTYTELKKDTGENRYYFEGIKAYVDIDLSGYEVLEAHNYTSLLVNDVLLG